MALNSYLSLTGKKQGLIKGSVTQKGREGKIMVIAATHGVNSPRDAATGQSSGVRRHSPFVITKELDASSPHLYTALAGNEVLSAWELQFWSASGTTNGAEVMRYTVRLVNATVSDIRFHMPNNKNPELVRYAEYEEVAFTYERIEWTWVLGGLKASDGWASTQAATAKGKPAAKLGARAARTKS